MLSGKRFVQMRGTSFTLRTFSEGAKDADYEDPAETSSDATVKAVFAIDRGRGRKSESAGGEEITHDATFTVMDGDEPAVNEDFRRAEFPGVDGNDYVVEVIGPAEHGARRLFCRRKR